MTRPAENQQTVEALEARVLRGINNSPVNWDGGRSSWADDARAALRDLAAKAELAAELGKELRRITECKPVSATWRNQQDVDRVKELLARLDGANE